MTASNSFVDRVRARVEANPCLRFDYFIRHDGEFIRYPATTDGHIFQIKSSTKIGSGAYGKQLLCVAAPYYPADSTLLPTQFLLKEEFGVYGRYTESLAFALNAVTSHDTRGFGAFCGTMTHWDNPLKTPAYIMVQYFPGVNLTKQLSDCDANTYLNYCLKLALDLRHFHVAALAHGDVKIENMLLDEEKQSIRLIDFDVTRLVGEKTVGSKCDYHPLELRERIPADLSQDIYSLAIAFSEFKQKNSVVLSIEQAVKFHELTAKMLSSKPSTRPTVDDVIAGLMQMAMAKDAKAEPLCPNPPASTLPSQKLTAVSDAKFSPVVSHTIAAAVAAGARAGAAAGAGTTTALLANILGPQQDNKPEKVITNASIDDKGQPAPDKTQHSPKLAGVTFISGKDASYKGDLATQPVTDDATKASALKKPSFG